MGVCLRRERKTDRQTINIQTKEQTVEQQKDKWKERLNIYSKYLYLSYVHSWSYCSFYRLIYFLCTCLSIFFVRSFWSIDNSSNTSPQLTGGLLKIPYRFCHISHTHDFFFFDLNFNERSTKEIVKQLLRKCKCD